MVTRSKEALRWPGPWLTEQVILLLNPGILSVMVTSAPGTPVNVSMIDSFRTLGLGVAPEGLCFLELPA